jgi:hypothetical protein
MSENRWQFPWVSLGGILSTHQVHSSVLEVVDGQDSTAFSIVPRNDKQTGSGADFDTSFTLHISRDAQIVSIDYLQPSDNNRFVTTPCRIVYKGLHLQSGVMVPVSEDIYRRGELVRRLTFSQIELHPRADDARFNLTAQGGAK